MQLGLNALYAFLDACPTPQLILATVIRTEGASYRKAGAMMLIDANMQSMGLVSGGCLEDDLKAHAEPVLLTGECATVVYDLSQEEAASLWGLGLGCGGRIEVLLERIDADNEYGGLGAVRNDFYSGHTCILRKLVVSPHAQTIGSYKVENVPNETLDSAASSAGITDAAVTQAELHSTERGLELAIPISPVNRLLVCGAGPDTIPLVALASQLSWQVVVSDPRPDYLQPEFFPGASALLCEQPQNVSRDAIGPIQAAVIMTHNVERDSIWLKKLYALPVDYIGLLGPTARRNKLLEDAGLKWEPRLHGPAGLDIGATLPEEIALSIIAQMHAALAKRTGRFLSQTAD